MPKKDATVKPQNRKNPLRGGDGQNRQKCPKMANFGPQNPKRAARSGVGPKWPPKIPIFGPFWLQNTSSKPKSPKMGHFWSSFFIKKWEKSPKNLLLGVFGVESSNFPLKGEKWKMENFQFWKFPKPPTLPPRLWEFLAKTPFWGFCQTSQWRTPSFPIFDPIFETSCRRSKIAIFRKGSGIANLPQTPAELRP